ncbi:hypothetical protein [Pseudoroseomonas cervicalis]|uniref:hypothetical protein n=1 Tax=Teichococcus cervicalis TaxID=204525 RepID=UPI0022F1969C|nr:hypothetical protein [Pseudoroseomonas cervicalis]WBV45532.1 hypothetical protein PFY06_21205 [Pseudoroseomonas cervicalis]
MSLGLTLLLNAAGTALDRLWQLRLQRDGGVVLPDYLDPGLPAPLEPAPDGSEAAARDRLLRIGAQMRGIGLAPLAAAILQAALPARRRAALLALAGSAPWQPVPGLPGLCQRASVEGALYWLECRAGRAAEHAPHAMRDQEQRLWLLAGPPACAALPADAPDLARRSGFDCLSQDAALRDVVLGLRAMGEAGLAGQVAALLGALEGEQDVAWLARPALPVPARAPAAA